MRQTTKTKWSLPLLSALLVAGTAPASQAQPLDPAPRVINGSDVTPGEAPWMAAVYYSNALYPGTPTPAPADSWFCGGVVVAPQYVLTAAHCVINAFGGSPLPPLYFGVVVGRTALRGVGGELAEVEAVIVHRNYDPFAQAPANDLALLRLKSPVSVPPLRPVQPGEEGMWAANAPAAVYGYGVSEQDLEAGFVRFPSVLQRGDVPIVSDATCVADYGLGFVPEVMVCAGRKATSATSGDGVDACYGDSGGPLVVRAGGEARLAGVVSYGAGARCADHRAVGVYSEVAAFRDWIESPPPAPPVALDAATLEGIPELGSVLRCRPPIFAGDAAELSYSWGVSDLPTISYGFRIIEEATSETYVVNVPPGSYLFCRVMARNAGGQAVAESSPVGPVADSTPPSLTAVGNSCSRRSCEVTVAAFDASEVAFVSGRLVKSCYFSRPRSCGRVLAEVEATSPDGVSWSFRLPRRSRGQTLLVTAADGGGNTTPDPLIVRVGIRARR